MPGVQELNLGIGNIASVSLRAGRHKERVILSPHCKQRRPARTEIFLEFRIEGDIAGIVQEQIELNLFVAGTCQESGIQLVCFGRNQRFILDAIRILRLRSLRCEKCTQRQAILFRRLLPVFLDRIPTLAETFFIRVAVLRDDRGDSLGVRKSQTKADGSAIIENVDGEAVRGRCFE